VGRADPSSGFPYWLFQTLTTTNDTLLANDAGTQVKFDDPKVIEALQYWVDLGKAGVHPPGVVEWGTTPKDFFEKKVAIMYTTTGNLTNVKNNAKFDFGVAMIPGNKRKGSPTGGGNFYIFKKASPAQQEAAFKFIKWITQPERAAEWSMDTGYVAVSPAAYGTDTLRKIRARFPPAMVAPETSLPVLGRGVLHACTTSAWTKALNDGAAGRADRHQDAGRGDAGKRARSRPPVAQLQVIFKRRQRGQRRGPVIAAVHACCCCCRRLLLLVRFTHWPAVATFIDSFHGHPPQGRPAGVWVGLETTRPWPTTRCSGRRSRTTCGSPAPPSRCRSGWRW
jgi:hypothetical protein